uniref:Ricin B-type lectin domain-containing protein n=1 Tax=Strongyloides venezuelensis TaxID=75913 RepID=A0A0K0EWG3_STRVS
MEKVLQLVWILALYSITVNSFDIEKLFDNLNSYRSEDFARPIKTHVVKWKTDVIAVKCYNSQLNKQVNYNGVQKNFSYDPNKLKDNKRITIDLIDSKFFWIVSKISKSGNQEIHCGTLRVNSNVHKLIYKYTISDENSTNKLKKWEDNSATNQNSYFYAYSKSKGLRNYNDLVEIAEDDIVYVFKIDNQTPDQVLEPDSIMENPPPPTTPLPSDSTTPEAEKITTEDDKKNSTGTIGIFPSIIFSIMFIINKIIH